MKKSTVASLFAKKKGMAKKEPMVAAAPKAKSPAASIFKKKKAK